jgi:hypothetical protein
VFLPIALKSAEIVPPPEPTEEPGGTEEPTEEATMPPGGTEEPTEEPTPAPTLAPDPDVSAVLEEVGGSGTTGDAYLWQRDEDVYIMLATMPPTHTRPAAIVDAVSCDDLGDLLWELEDVVDGESETWLVDTDLALVADGSNAIVVYEGVEDETVIACGMLEEYVAP